MEDIVAVAVDLDAGERRFFLTWGRIQDPVDRGPLERLILEQSTGFALGGKPLRAKVCSSLQVAADEPFFEMKADVPDLAFLNTQRRYWH